MKKVVEREKNKNYYRVLHVPIWIWVFWILPGHLTADLYAHGPDRRHWIWLAIVTAVCIWRGFAGRLPGGEPRPYITHYGEPKPNLWYRVVCYTAAWIDLLVPFTINLIGLAINFFFGRWIINDLFYKLYYPLAAAIVLATISGSYAARAPVPPAMKARKKAGFTLPSGLLFPRSLPDGPCGGWENILIFHLPAWVNVRLATFLIVAGTFLRSGIAGQTAAHSALPHS